MVPGDKFCGVCGKTVRIVEGSGEPSVRAPSIQIHDPAEVASEELSDLLQTADASYSASIPLEAVADQGLIVYRLGDEPVPEEKGGPVRFFIVDVESCALGAGEVDRCANVKFLHRIDFSTERGADSRPPTEEQHERLHEDS